jgi:hypothetical protein
MAGGPASAKEIRAVPPAIAKKLCQAADEANKAQMHMQHSPPKPNDCALIGFGLAMSKE